MQHEQCGNSMEDCRCRCYAEHRKTGARLFFLFLPIILLFGSVIVAVVDVVFLNSLLSMVNKKN